MPTAPIHYTALCYISFQGVPPRATLNFLMTYGVGRAQQATQKMFFKNYGLTERKKI